jgi:uncharacterized surface protein with fasciclin (FAS1) repeats
MPMNVTSTLANANLTAAAGAIKSAGLVQALGNMKDVTIFAPNNDAFNAIGSVVANLSATDLAGVLEYHVVSNAVAYSSMLKNETITTLDGKNLTISIINGAVYVSDSMSRCQPSPGFLQ